MKCLNCSEETKYGTAIFKSGKYLGILCKKCYQNYRSK